MSADKPQHLRALDRANEVRMSNADLFRRLRDMPRRAAYATLAELLEAHAEHDDRPFDRLAVRADAFVRVRVDRAVKACPSTGEATVAKALRVAGVYARDKRVDDLTRRQLVALAYVLRHPLLFAPRSRATLEDVA